VVGRADARRAFDRRSSRAAIALCHNPDGADALEWGDYRGWILAGHTHGGQCRPPFLPPPLLPVRNRRYAAGEVGAPGGRTLYISRGVGYYLHVRFNVRPEVTLFTLRPAAA
jgi:predicted MPP superfamily phosphohydrolase